MAAHASLTTLPLSVCLVPLIFAALLIVAAVAVPFLWPTPAPARAAFSSAAVVTAGSLVWGVTKIRVMFLVYTVTEDKTVFPRGRWWLSSGWWPKGPPEWK